ncbi:Uncharacterised protein [Segatella copri]|nr:Uncharacterised protein [Segatella copri]
MIRTVHTREEHVLGIDILILVTYYEVRVLLISRSFLLALVNRCAFFHDAAQITSQGKDVLRRVLVHRRVGRRTDYDECVAGITNHQHQHAEQGCILDAC